MQTIYIVLFIINLILIQCETKYEPNWDSLDKRPLPQWYDEAKIGIFIHWGVFSVPSYGSEWFWYFWQNGNSIDAFMKKNYPPNFTYQDFATQFTAEFFNPKQWAELFKNSGAKYVVLTSKHHEGYTLWPSKYSYSWNSQDVGSHRDLVDDLRKAIRNNTDLKFGLYHSMMEWFHPLYVSDKEANFTKNQFPLTKSLPELYELVQSYEPDVVWSDGVREASDNYWLTREFLAWLYNESPVKDVVVVNDQWSKEAICKHGDFLTCHDKFNPGVLQEKKWENDMSIDRLSFGYRRNAALKDYLTVDELIKELVTTVSCGGNILINIGPTKEGTIPLIFQERLTDLGSWLKINEEAIYKSSPWIHQNDTINSNVWYTTRNDLQNVYAFILKWPNDNNLVVGYSEEIFNSNMTVSILGLSKEIQWSKTNENEVLIPLPVSARIQLKWSWVLKFEKL